MENINETNNLTSSKLVTEINDEYFIQKIIDVTNIPEKDIRAVLDALKNIFQIKN